MKKNTKEILLAGWLFQRYNGLCYWSDENSARGTALRKYKYICETYKSTIELAPLIRVRPDYFPNLDKGIPGWEIGFSLQINGAPIGRILGIKLLGKGVSLITEGFTLTVRNPEVGPGRESYLNELTKKDTDTEGIKEK